jgi:hypothetical protein
MWYRCRQVQALFGASEILQRLFFNSRLASPDPGRWRVPQESLNAGVSTTIWEHILWFNNHRLNASASCWRLESCRRRADGDIYLHLALSLRTSRGKLQSRWAWTIFTVWSSNIFLCHRAAHLYLHNNVLVSNSTEDARKSKREVGSAPVPVPKVYHGTTDCLCMREVYTCYVRSRVRAFESQFVELCPPFQLHLQRHAHTKYINNIYKHMDMTFVQFFSSRLTFFLFWH